MFSQKNGRNIASKFNDIKNVFADQWVSDIIQDKDGFIWVGSQDGLHKYDGKNFKSFRYNPKQRLKLAIQLLKESDSTVAEIAYQVGFNSSSYFIKCFKDVYNCTPNEYLSKS